MAKFCSTDTLRLCVDTLKPGGEGHLRPLVLFSSKITRSVLQLRSFLRLSDSHIFDKSSRASFERSDTWRINPFSFKRVLHLLSILQHNFIYIFDVKITVDLSKTVAPVVVSLRFINSNSSLDFRANSMTLVAILYTSKLIPCLLRQR